RVVPCRAGTAIDLSGLEDESSALGQGDDGIQLRLCHYALSLIRFAHGRLPWLPGTSLTGRGGGPATTVPTDEGAGDLRRSDALLNRRRRQTASRLIHTPKPFSVPTFSRPSKRVLGPLRFLPGLLEMIAQAAAG